MENPTTHIDSSSSAYSVPCDDLVNTGYIDYIDYTDGNNNCDWQLISQCMEIGLLLSQYLEIGLPLPRCTGSDDYDAELVLECIKEEFLLADYIEIYSYCRCIGIGNNNIGTNSEIRNICSRSNLTDSLPTHQYQAHQAGSNGGAVNNPCVVDAPLNDTPWDTMFLHTLESNPMSMGHNPPLLSTRQGNSQPGSPQQQSPPSATASRASTPPQNSLRFEHDELSMPSNFRANPNNHGRFRYHANGTREYLNAPSNRRRRT